MEKKFSAWGKQADDLPFILVAGESQPRAVNGEILPDCEKCFWVISVGNFDEASAIFNLRNGYEPYKPHGNPEPCPRCNSFFYPDGFAQCWNCDFQC